MGWFKSSSVYRSFDRIDGEPMEFEWNIFPGFKTLQLSEEVKRLLFRLDETREFHRKNPIYVDVQRHLRWNKRQRNRMSGKCQIRISVREKIWERTAVVYWSWFYGGKDDVGIRRKRTFNFPTSPLSRGRLKSKGHGKLSIHYYADLETIDTIFRTIVSVNQLQQKTMKNNACEVDVQSSAARTQGRRRARAKRSGASVRCLRKAWVKIVAKDVAV